MNAEKPVKPLFSVIIPTFNRAGLLAGALESLLQQTLEAHAFEIIVVDNRSTDGTRALVENMAAACAPHTIRYRYEAQPGGGVSRRAGAAIARADWVAYMDDDGQASAGWLQNAAQILEAKPDLDGMGGPIHPFYLAERPQWFKDEYEIRAYGEQPRLLERDEAFSGANMLFSRTLLEKVSTAMNGLGMVGEMMQFGEDTIIFEQAWTLPGRPQFYYHPELVMYHAVPARNMDVGYILRRQFTIGAGNFRRVGPRGCVPRVGYILHHSGSLLKLAARMLLARPRAAVRENWLVEWGAPVAKKLGLLSAALGLRIQFRQRQQPPAEARHG